MCPVIGGGIIGGGSGEVPVVEYLYIDGGYLRCVLKDYARDYFDNDVLDREFWKRNERYQRKFYYDCEPARQKGESDDQFALRAKEVSVYFDYLRRLPGFHVHLGTVVREGGRARQKGVDVQLTTHMLTHSFRGIAKRATIIAGDRDFVPLARALVDEGTYLTVWSRRSDTASELIDAADNHLDLDPFEIHNSVTQRFREAHRHLRRWNEPGLLGQVSEDGYIQVMQGTLSDHFPISIHEGPRGAVLVMGSENEYFRHFSFPNREMLNIYMADQRISDVSWQ